MSPSGLTWFQGCLFYFLGVVTPYFFDWLKNRRTNRGTSNVDLTSVLVDLGRDLGNTQNPLYAAESSSGDEEARSPSNFWNPVGEAMASTGSFSCSDRRSESLKHPRSLLQPSADTRKTSHFLEFEAETEVPNFARSETACSTGVAERTPSPMSSPTAGLLRPSGGEDEALSPSHPGGEALAKDEARNVGRPIQYNMDWVPYTSKFHYTPVSMDEIDSIEYV